MGNEASSPEDRRISSKHAAVNDRWNMLRACLCHDVRRATANVHASLSHASLATMCHTRSRYAQVMDESHDPVMKHSVSQEHTLCIVPPSMDVWRVVTHFVATLASITPGASVCIVGRTPLELAHGASVLTSELPDSHEVERPRGITRIGEDVLSVTRRGMGLEGDSIVRFMTRDVANESRAIESDGIRSTLCIFVDVLTDGDAVCEFALKDIERSAASGASVVIVDTLSSAPREDVEAEEPYSSSEEGIEVQMTGDPYSLVSRVSAMCARTDTMDGNVDVKFAVVDSLIGRDIRSAPAGEFATWIGNPVARDASLEV